MTVFVESSVTKVNTTQVTDNMLTDPGGNDKKQRRGYQRRRNHGGAGGASPPENLTKGAGTFYVQCSTARSVDLRVRASSRRVCARATLRVPAQHAWEGSCK